MEHILLTIMVLVSVTACGQSGISVEQINKEYDKTMQDTSRLQKKVFSSMIEAGVLDTTKIYFKDNQVKYIYYHRYIGGLTSVDDHFYKEFLYMDGKLVFIRTLLKWDYFDKGFTPDSKTKLEEQLAYLDMEGECLKYYEEREATETRVTVMEELKRVPLKEKDCMYCRYDGDEGEKYLEKLNK